PAAGRARPRGLPVRPAAAGRQARRREARRARGRPRRQAGCQVHRHDHRPRSLQHRTPRLIMEPAMTDIVVKTVEELKSAPEEYREAVSKLVISHAINELYGAQVFDEPAIALAPTPYAKWLTCRVAMEEYGHHVRFKGLGTQIGIPEER